MRRSLMFTAVSLAAAALAAFAAPAAAADRYTYLALGDSIPSASGNDRRDHIEILSYSWGSTQAAGKKSGGVDYVWSVQEGESAPPPAGGVRVAAGDVNGDPDRPVIAGNVPNASAGTRQHRPITIAKDVDKAPPPAEKRQHGWVAVSKPLDRGSVRAKVKFPWVGCVVGARYPDITLGDGARSYRLQDVTVASCGGAAGQDEGPEESITFVYGKLGVK
jgi:hypothetical protein